MAGVLVGANVNFVPRLVDSDGEKFVELAVLEANSEQDFLNNFGGDRGHAGKL